MSTCSNCGKVMGLHSSILQGCMCQYSMQAPPQRTWVELQAPPQRTWVGLTDEERNDCLVDADPCECLADPEAEELMRCIEAKLKDKNGYAEEKNT